MSIESLETTSISGSYYDDDIERNSTTSSSIVTNTTRRLTNAKVRAIFESLYNSNIVPPVPFIIVPVNSNGKALSPPSYEFEYGIYILLRPVKGGKSKASDIHQAAQVPKHLQHLVMTQYPPETCKWQLSGPQFPTPTAIQQRYCYPQGREEYSQCTGSALWTMYNMDGIENKEYRLLHVYYSTKRLHNGGVRNGKSTIDMIDMEHLNTDELGSVYTLTNTSTKLTGKLRKLPKRIKVTKVNYPRTLRKAAQAIEPPYEDHQYHHTVALSPPNPQLPPIQTQRRYLPTPLHGGLPTSPIQYGPITTYDTTSTSGYTVSPPSPWPETTGVGSTGDSNMYNNRYRPQAPYQRYYNRSMLMMESSNSEENVQSNYSYEHSRMQGSSSTTTPQVLPFRRQYQYHHHHHPGHDNKSDEYEPISMVPPIPIEKTDDPQKILSSSTDETINFSNFTNDFHHYDHHHDDLHSIMMTPINHNNDDDDAESTALWEDVSGEKLILYDHNNDPFTRMTSCSPQRMTNIREEHGNVHDDNSKQDIALVPIAPSDICTDCDNFQLSLEMVHSKLRDCINQAPSHDQPELVQLLSSWARELADDPLVVISPKETTTTMTIYKGSGGDGSDPISNVLDTSADHNLSCHETTKK